MQVHHEILNCTAFIGAPLERGKFHAEGTGFFLAMEQEGLHFAYLVTCRHVLDNLGSVPPVVRVNRKTNPPALIRTERVDWLGHANDRLRIDIAVLPFDKWNHDDSLDIGFLSCNSAMLTEKLAKYYGFSLGNEVLIAGVFVGRVGEQRNIPIVRVGNIAALPSEPAWPRSPTRPAYLIETRSLGGISGSPVFLHGAPGQLHGGPRGPFPNAVTGEIILPYYLVGMIIGSHSGKYASDFAADDPDAVEPPKDVDFNAGISVAIPVEQIVETLNQPRLQTARDVAVAAKKREVESRDP